MLQGQSPPPPTPPTYFSTRNSPPNHTSYGLWFHEFHDFTFIFRLHFSICSAPLRQGEDSPFCFPPHDHPLNIQRRLFPHSPTLRSLSLQSLGGKNVCSLLSFSRRMQQKSTAQHGYGTVVGFVCLVLMACRRLDCDKKKRKKNLIKKRYFAHANDGHGREDKTLFRLLSFPFLIPFSPPCLFVCLFVGVLCLGGVEGRLFVGV